MSIITQWVQRSNYVEWHYVEWHMLNGKNIQGGQALLSQTGLQGRGRRERVVGNRPACSTWRIGMLFLVEAGPNPTSYK